MGDGARSAHVVDTRLLGLGGGGYLWHAGYWGPHVGFYGGINYGFGYDGRGFEGGEWRGRDFFYNRSVNNFGSAHFTNVYERTVVNNYAVNPSVITAVPATRAAHPRGTRR